jgi:hypothetical protein
MLKEGHWSSARLKAESAFEQRENEVCTSYLLLLVFLPNPIQVLRYCPSTGASCYPKVHVATIDRDESCDGTGISRWSWQLVTAASV